jgi:hypothetical protein
MAPKPPAHGKETRLEPGAAQSWLAQIRRISFPQTWRQDKRRLLTMELFSEPGAEQRSRELQRR